MDKMVPGASKNQIAMGSRDHLPNPHLADGETEAQKRQLGKAPPYILKLKTMFLADNLGLNSIFNSYYYICDL